MPEARGLQTGQQAFWRDGRRSGDNGPEAWHGRFRVLRLPREEVRSIWGSEIQSGYAALWM